MNWWQGLVAVGGGLLLLWLAPVRCPTVLLVVCVDTATATWCATPIERPLVLAVKLGAVLGDRQRVANRAGRGALRRQRAGRVERADGRDHADTTAPCVWGADADESRFATARTGGWALMETVAISRAGHGAATGLS
ncbi:MAG: hypothetical protein DLM61_09825 [Pseudonocardiales bacterium]|nr:MAG: hypothetical protein DLM61_09825 [Pseudonocardiales bacterium]